MERRKWTYKQQPHNAIARNLKFTDNEENFRSISGNYELANLSLDKQHVSEYFSRPGPSKVMQPPGDKNDGCFYSSCISMIPQDH